MKYLTVYMWPLALLSIIAAFAPVAHAINIACPTATDGDVLTCDAVGMADWEPAAGGGGTVACSDVTDSTAAGCSVLTAADAAAQRTAMDVDQAGTDNSTDVTVSGTPDYITLVGQDLVRGLVDLSTDATGSIPDGSVPESAVTQHEAALAITESQITDLGTYLENPMTVAIEFTGDGEVAATGDIDLTATGNDVNIEATNLNMRNLGSIRWFDSGSSARGMLSLNNSNQFMIGNVNVQKYFFRNSNPRIGIGRGTDHADTELDIDGVLTLREQSADPASPDEGAAAFWLSDGTATGEDGEVWVTITAGGVTDDYIVAGQLPYGIMSVQAGSTGEGTVDGTPRILTAWNTNGLSNETTVDHTADSILVGQAGSYKVDSSLSFSGSGSSTADLELYVYDDSATSWGASGFSLSQRLESASDVESVSINGIVQLDASDGVAIYQSSTGSALTIKEAQLTIHRISN